MSLTRCPHCQYQNSWVSVYLTMNLKHRFSGKIIRCKGCERKLILEKCKGRDWIQKMYSSLLWTGFPLLIIGLVALRYLDYKSAILAVIMYHFVCFAGIIAFGEYSKTEK